MKLFTFSFRIFTSFAILLLCGIVFLFSQDYTNSFKSTDLNNQERDQILLDTEVQRTLSRIEKTQPKYRQDGAIFMNREKRLPIKSEKAYYREWTVDTPWENDRWPRRIVIGKGWEYYFTADHYKNFQRIYIKNE